MSGFELEVVTPLGVMVATQGVESVVVRREDGGRPGCEVAVLRAHAPMLTRTSACELRWVVDGRTHRTPVGAGVMEVLDGRVTIVVSSTSYRPRPSNSDHSPGDSAASQSRNAGGASPLK